MTEMLDTDRPASAEPVRSAGVHSLAEVALDVPDLEQARGFYEAFGLKAAARGASVALRGQDDGLRGPGPETPHAATLYEGVRKRLRHLTFGVFADDLPGLRRRLQLSGVKEIDPPAGVEPRLGAVWIADPDGTPVQLAPGPKLTPAAYQDSRHPEPQGWRHSPPRAAIAARPHRLGHAFLFTSDLERTTNFYVQALGLGLSDRNDHVSFLHGRYGSDHHIIGFAQSSAPGFHHFSWEVANIDQIGVGGQAMAARGHGGWGFGRHVAGSNWFWYVRDPWGSWAEYFCDIDYVPEGAEVPRRELPPEDSVYLWGPPMPEDFILNREAVTA